VRKRGEERTSRLRALCISSLLNVSTRSSGMRPSCSQPQCDRADGLPELTWFKSSRQCLSIMKKQERASIYKTIVDLGVCHPVYASNKLYLKSMDSAFDVH